MHQQEIGLADRLLEQIAIKRLLIFRAPSRTFHAQHRAGDRGNAKHRLDTVTLIGRPGAEHFGGGVSPQRLFVAMP